MDFCVTFMLDLKHGDITGIPFTKYGNRMIYFLHNSSSKIGWRRDIFFTLLHHNITCFELYLCYNLIIVCYPAGRPSSWGIALPYVTPPPPSLARLLPSLLPLYVYACGGSKHFSLLPQLPFTAVKSNIAALSPLQRNKTWLDSIKNSHLLGWSAS